jgi:anti-sigma factor RsiW
MKHLTDEQFSALLDGALPAAELSACEAHLEGCDTCRERLAEAGALDDTLEQSLAHDPGEAYFESFADRVAARIAGQGAGEAARSARPESTGGRSLWGWLVSPRGLATAGSTAALVLVAGLAWVRFHEPGGMVATRRAPSDSPLDSRLRLESESPAPSDQKAEPQEVALLPAPPSPDAAPPPAGHFAGSPTPPQASRLQESAGAREVRRNESGEDVPVRPSAPAAESRARDEATTSKLGMMKQRSAAPATGGALSLGAPAPAPAPAPSSAKRSPAPTANEPPAARALAPSPADGVASAERELDTSATTRALAPCGSVHDSRGRAVSGAQVVVVNDITRTSRTGADGSFCLPRLERGDVVSVLRVGYDPVRITVDEDSPLAVVMEPVGTLGPEAGKGLVTPGAPSAGTRGFLSGTPKQVTPTMAKASAPVPDPYATQPANVREAVAAAREGAHVARRDRSADAMDAAALRWDAVTALVTGALVHDARFQALSLRRESLSATPTSERLTRFNVGLQLFLAQTPHDLPEYATALSWKSQFSRTNKALYR